MNTSINTGGPAFPVGSGDMRDPMGMTLRDYFAAKALQGLLSHNSNGNASEKSVAKWAYTQADAMLHAREAT